MKTLRLPIACGETTCTTPDGQRCRFLGGRSVPYVCGAFRDEAGNAPETGLRLVVEWFVPSRLPECIAATSTEGE